MDDHRIVSDFYDDSSTALHIGHHYRRLHSALPNDATIVPSLTPEERAQKEIERAEAAIREQRITEPLALREINGVEIADATRDTHGNIVPSNAGAYAEIERRSREYQAQGYSLADATALAIAEISPEDPPASKQPAGGDYLGASITSLMSHRKPQGTTGGGSGRKRQAKPGTKMCKTCNLERKNCGCYSGRSEFVGTRVSQKVKDALEAQEVSSGEIVEAIVNAAMEKGGPRAVRSLLDSIAKANTLRDDACPRCSELAPDMMCGSCANRYARRGVRRKVRRQDSHRGIA